MARKKPSGGDSPKRRKKPSRPALPPQILTEQMFRQMFGDGAPAAETPLERAQELVYEARIEAAHPERQVELARQALEIAPDCADALVLLAEHAPTRREALGLYRQAVAAGERALGPDAFRDAVGDFWGLLETRPYMRARMGLAQALWTAGRRDEAVQHAREMLRLNPGDNQGVRYTLASWLLAEDRADDLAALLEQYPDEGTAFWAYTRALLAFRRGGDSPESQRLLQAARKANKHVPAYLLREKQLPEEPPPYYGLGDENEAVFYAADNLQPWRATPGAVEWLRRHAGPKKKPAAPRKAAPTAAALKRIKQLPQTEEVWLVAARRLPTWAPADGGMVRPWVILVLSRDRVLGHDITTGAPVDADAWAALTQAMANPVEGQPHRPRAVEGGPGLPWEELRSRLDGLGVELRPAGDLAALDAVVTHLSRHICGEPLKGLLDVPGMTPERAASFFDAAAEFFEQRPWRRVGLESALKVECDATPGGPWYAVVMGQSGMTYGLALYDDLAVLLRQWRAPGSDEENARDVVATTVTFGDPWETSVADVDAAEAHGWRVARPDAFPAVFRKECGLSMRPPTPRELELLEACLRAVPGHVRGRPQDDPTPETVTVRTGAGDLRLTLSWVTE